MSMMEKNRTPNFEMTPTFEMKGIDSFAGDEIAAEIKKAIAAKKQDRTVVVLDYWLGVTNDVVVEKIVKKLNPAYSVDTTTEIKYPEEYIQEQFGQFITDDRENGVFCTCHMKDFFDPAKAEAANKKIEETKGTVVVYGVGASEMFNPDILVFCNIEQEEVHRRFNKGMPNWGATNFDEDPLRKDKRYKFLEERMLEWHLLHQIKDIDYMIDCTDDAEYKMLEGNDWREVMDRFLARPFKMVPYYRVGLWGGQWTKKVCGCGQDSKNIAWFIHGFVDRCAVRAKCGKNVVMFPTKDIEFYKPLDLLGPDVFYLFGYINPCTLDFLDTFGGGNLSLQVHPTCAYNVENFNYQYPHCESYYMLDTNENSSVYLGLKNGVKVDDFVNALREAQKTGKFDDTKWVNRIPMHTHDHIYIPSGTVHCSGVDTLVLEINTLMCSTFKLWDWGRIGLDGKPRPINVERGKDVIQEWYDTDFTLDRLVDHKKLIARGEGWRKEKSGLMEYEPLIVDRYWATKPVMLENRGRIKSLCLVEGEEAIIESPVGAFEPLVMHYAEAIIVPSHVGQFIVRPYGKSEGTEIAFLECYQNLGSEN